MKSLLLILTAATLIPVLPGYGQPFVNLDFEHPILPLIPVNFQVPITKAMPGWNGYIGGIQISNVTYNTVSIGSSEINFQGPGSLEPILQGSYTVGMGPSSQGFSTAIGQTGTLPNDAKSISFYIAPGSIFSVSFAGNQIPVSVIGSTSVATIVGGDISAFAGQTGQLLFQGGGELDNIQFSSSPIPEPSGLALFGVGTLVFGLVRRRESLT